MQWRIQDFPEEERQFPSGVPTYEFAKVSPKLHEIERIWTPGGVHIPRAPLRSATAMGVYENSLKYILRFSQKSVIIMLIKLC